MLNAELVGHIGVHYFVVVFGRLCYFGNDSLSQTLRVPKELLRVVVEEILLFPTLLLRSDGFLVVVLNMVFQFNHADFVASITLLSR